MEVHSAAMQSLETLRAFYEAPSSAPLATEPEKLGLKEGRPTTGPGPLSSMTAVDAAAAVAVAALFHSASSAKLGPLPGTPYLAESASTDKKRPFESREASSSSEVGTVDAATPRLSEVLSSVSAASSGGSEDDLCEDEDGGVVFKRRRLTADERQQRSRERNRMHAKKTRMRKKQQMDALSTRVDELRTELTGLRTRIEERYTAYILLNMVDLGQSSTGAEGGAKAGSPAAEEEDPHARMFKEVLQRAREARDQSAELGNLSLPDPLEALEDKDKRTRRRGKYTQQERETIRRERNRMHAKRTRDRKKMFLEEAELAILRVETENARLRAFMSANGMAAGAEAVPVAKALSQIQDELGDIGDAEAAPGDSGEDETPEEEGPEASWPAAAACESPSEPLAPAPGPAAHV